RRASRVIPLEPTSTQHRNSHRLKVVAADDAQVGVMRRLWVRQRMLANGEKRVHSLPVERQLGDESRRLHSRQRLHAWLYLTVEGDALCFLFVLLPDQRDLRRRNLVGVESRVQVNQPPEIIEKETRRDEHDKRQRHFGDNEQAMRSVLGARADGGATFFQVSRRLNSARGERRAKSE